MAVTPAANVTVGLGLDIRNQPAGVWIRRGISSFLAWVEGPIGSYVLLALLQLRVIWGDWRLRDITSGDTSAYFQNAARWADQMIFEGFVPD